MNVPGYNEAEVLAVIEHIAAILIPKFRESLAHDSAEEDLAQEVRLYCLQALPKFDPATGKLSPFLYVHARNRLLNRYRDKVWRGECPCKPCKRGDFCGGPDGPCEAYKKWHLRNSRKSNLAKPLDIGNVCEPRTEEDVTADVEVREIVRLIDEKLPVELRSWYLKMRENVKIGREKRRLVEHAVGEILGEAGIQLPGLTPPPAVAEEEEAAA